MQTGDQMLVIIKEQVHRLLFYIPGFQQVTR